MEATLIQLGVAGVFLYWLMVRVEGRMNRLETGMNGVAQAMDRATRAQMLALIDRDDTKEPIKAQARALLRELAPVPISGAA